MKQLLITLFVLNINTAWAHTGHSNNAFIFAFSIMGVFLLTKPVLKMIKIKKDD